MIETRFLKSWTLQRDQGYKQGQKVENEKGFDMFFRESC